MTLQELYASIEGDYERARAYLRSERLIARVVCKFPDDTACPRLIAAWEAGDWDEAFSAAHEAKGVCANLYLTHLADLTSQICEALRHHSDRSARVDDIDTLVADLRTQYTHTVEAIARFVAEQ